MSIQTELTRITNAKTAIKTAIEGKGVTVPSGTKLDGMAALIEAIEAGGGDTSVEDGLIERIITEYSNSRVTKIGNYVFNQYATLTKADFPAVTSIGNYAFNYCSKLKTANFPVATSIGNSAFYACSTLTKADFPAATSIGNYAFRTCKVLSTADFPAVTSIGENAFYQCERLATANFPVVTSIGKSAFYRCSFAKANFPAATSIGNSAFDSCSKLEKANFPVATSIENSAFYNCSKLNALILRNEIMCKLSNTNAFTNTPIKSGTGYIYVPSALLASYQAATNWSTFSAQFRAIEDYPDICGGNV